MGEIDFSNCRNFDNMYFTHGSGYHQLRMHILYDDDVYFLKTGQMCAHECFSEYIGSHIFDILGIPSQKTLLGTLDCYGRKEPAVACKLISTGNCYAYFLSNMGERFGGDMNIYSFENVLNIANKQTLVDADVFVKNICRILAVDAYIGNYDRFSAGNLGWLCDEKGNYLLLPVIDNGNCLLAHSADRMPSLFADIASMVRHGNSIVTDTYESLMRRYGTFSWNGASIDFYSFYKSVTDRNCIDGLRDVTERIENNEEKINQMIDDAPLIPELDKSVYKVMLHQRHRDILQRGLEINSGGSAFKSGKERLY